MKHTITILVENEFGVLTRIAGLFSARGYNIESLNVAPTLDETVSRLTLVTRGDERIIEQIKKQLNKLIPVIKTEDISHVVHIEREMILVKMVRDPKVLDIVKAFQATVIDDATDDYFIVELAGKDDELQSFLGALNSIGIIATARSGPVGMRREAKGFGVDF